MLIAAAITIGLTLLAINAYRVACGPWDANIIAKGEMEGKVKWRSK